MQVYADGGLEMILEDAGFTEIELTTPYSTQRKNLLRVFK